MRRPPLDSLVLGLCLLSLCACTSPLIHKGSNGIVRYQQYAPNNNEPSLELVLVQETHEDLESILSERREKAFIKKAPKDQYELLIQALVDECGFLDLVESAPPWESITSPGVLSVENEFGKWTLQSEHCAGDCTDFELSFNFAEMVNIFRHYFDNIFTLQRIEDEGRGGKRFFKKEQERLNKINQ